MIDWISGFIPLVHEPLKSGYVAKVSPTGEIEWEAPCRMTVEGSHSKSIQVRSEGGDGGGLATELYISGNPAKFLQGHNVFGSDNLQLLVIDTFLSVCSRLNLEIPPATLSAVMQGDYRLTRVDINYMYSLGTQADVRSWLRAAEFKSKTRHGRPTSKGGTVYYGKESRRWTLKAYSKFEEIKAKRDHQLPDHLLNTPIPQFAEDKLRLELTLRGKEMQGLGIEKGEDWTLETPAKMHGQYLKRIEMNEQIALSDKLQWELPNHLRSTYINWKHGYNPREILSRPTFYRHRRELLEHGIDIDLAVEIDQQTNVVPLVRVLEARPADIPEWAYEMGLIHGYGRANAQATGS